jgi:BirA family transcriptional regulator, biotin operon repressor / biotin---[acetyl-CoA-carboxylase] ligase
MADHLPREFAEALESSRNRLGRLGSPVVFFSTIGSTNDVASAMAASGDREGAVVIADEQTAGRGRRGHTWFSPPGSGLYVSIVLTPARARADRDRATMLLPLAAGVALAEAVDATTALRIDIKWPNDLLVARRKLGGILAEAVSAPLAPPREVRQARHSVSAPKGPSRELTPAAREALEPETKSTPTRAARALNTVDAVVLGYGINVGPMAYPPELSDRATSLESELDRPVERAQLWVETLAAISRRYEDLLDGRFDAILDAWRERAPASRGARVTWNTPGGLQAGVTEGIDDRGALLVRVGDRTERMVAGELTWL